MSPKKRTSAAPHQTVRVRAETVERVSPTFARVTFAGPELRAFGNPGATFDQRIKLIFPPEETGVLPDLGGGADWYADWLALPDDTRGAMRTYSIRDLLIDAAGETRFVVDFVLHLDPGTSGPAARWAGSAQTGDELLIVAPLRGHTESAGVEFAPAAGAPVLLAGDETAAPAIARIIEDLPQDARGIAFIEVPDASDCLAVAAPEGISVQWLVRGQSLHGLALIPAVLAHLGGGDGTSGEPEIQDVETEQLLWETPVFSGLGERITAAPNAGEPPMSRAGYFWIAGESGVATTLRRHLVQELGISRAQVAFMGYWRRGVAMKG